jgi:hypothetical protein
MSEPFVIIGTPISKSKSYILDKFLENQRAIHRVYPNSRLVMATCDPEFSAVPGVELISYGVTCPPDVPVWSYNIAFGRDALRRYTIEAGAEYLLFCDCDQTYDESVIPVLLEKIKGYDVIFSGVRIRVDGTWGYGGNFVMLSRKILEKIVFRTMVWSKDGKRGLAEDQILDYDLFKLRAKVRKGIFVANYHYRSADDGVEITPRPVGLFRRVVNSQPVRFVLVSLSMLLHYNVEWELHSLITTRLKE